MNDEVRAALEAPLDPSKVAVLTFGGRSVPYLEAWYVISAANGIFGFDGWSHEVLNIGFDGVRLYTARVKVSALGIERTDVGVGIVQGDSPESHETAYKAAATDGLKRALRTFGAQFGNELYDKGAAPSQGQQRPQERATPSESTRDAGFANVGQVLSWARDKYGMTRGQVFDALKVKGPDDINLDTAAATIEASVGVLREPAGTH